MFKYHKFYLILCLFKDEVNYSFCSILFFKDFEMPFLLFVKKAKIIFNNMQISMTMISLFDKFRNKNLIVLIFGFDKINPFF